MPCGPGDLVCLSRTAVVVRCQAIVLASLCSGAALYCALPRAEFTGMPILLPDEEDAYPPGVLTVDIDSPGMLGSH